MSPAPLLSIPADGVDRQTCVSPSCPFELCDSDCMGTRPSVTSVHKTFKQLQEVIYYAIINRTYSRLVNK